MQIFKIFKRYIKQHLWQLLLVIALLIFLNYIRSMMPLFIGKIFAILNGDDKSTLPIFINNVFRDKEVGQQLILVAVFMVITVIIRDLMNFGSDIGITIVSEGIGYNIQTDFYNHVQELPYSYLNHAQTGDLIQRSISDINRVKRFIGQVLPMCANAFFQIVIYSIQMIRINSTLSIILLVPIVGMLIGAIVYFRKEAKLFINIEEAEGALTADVQENLTGIRVVKAFSNEKHEINKFTKAMNKFIDAWRALMRKMSTYYGVMDSLTHMIMLLSFVLSVFFVKEGLLTFNQATSLFLYVEYVIWPTRTLGRQIGEMNRSDIAGERILEIVNEPTEFEISDGKKKPKIEGEIEFKDVFFAFQDSKTPTIKNINLKIKKGETIALVGQTGCGKSTLVSLLNRMLDPTSGSIYIDGINVLDINKKYLRKKVGLVLQEPFLFSRTIEENIGISFDTADKRLTPTNESTVRQVAKIASVNHDIERFAEGYNTIVGERGVTLSGGQKQRIAIARTLVEFKPILIFDDSLSAVDTDTDIRIRNALAKRDQKHTTIIITHRITTAMEADRIVVMKDGTISEIGTHHELIEKPGLYKDIWDIQNHFEKQENKGEV